MFCVTSSVKVPITKPFLPSRSELTNGLNQVFDSEWLTNNGAKARELESCLSERLDQEDFLFLANGTLALQLGIRALELTGEVITTPFTYIATVTSLMWERCRPVFVDIEPGGFNIDAKQVESAITERTSGILATHCFGWPVAIDILSEIAHRRGLKLMFDAAHAFGSNYKGQSIFKYGDASATSFHATKLFHTCEGGGIASRHPEIRQAIRELRNFGHLDQESFGRVGINAKNSELHATMGLSILPHMDEILQRRRMQVKMYWELFEGKGLMLLDPSNPDWNCAYAPIVLENESKCLEVKSLLESKGIGARRYFYPSLNTVHGLSQTPCPESEKRAQSVLCLPLYHDLEDSMLQEIAQVVCSVC